MNKYINPKITILSIFLFFILYLEPTRFGGVKFSHLWKLCFEYIFICVLLFSLSRRGVLKSRNTYRPKFVKMGYVYALTPLLLSPTVGDSLNSIFDSGSRLLPVIVIHSMASTQVSIDRLNFLFRYAPVFVSLSSIPFLLGFLNPLGKAYEIDRLYNVGSQAFVGIFQKPHAASLTLSLCGVLAIGMFFLANRTRFQIFWISVFTLLTTLSFLTYVRSGLVAFLGGTIVFLFSMKKVKHVAYTLLLLMVLTTTVYFVIPDSSVLKSRLLGQTRFTKAENHSIDQISSGRLTLWSTSLNILIDEEPMIWLCGLGLEEFYSKMGGRLGGGHLAHNGFIDELLLYGAIGLLSLILFLISIIYDIKKTRVSGVKSLGQALFATFLIFGFFQSFSYPLQILILSPSILYGYVNLPNRNGDLCV